MTGVLSINTDSRTGAVHAAKLIAPCAFFLNRTAEPCWIPIIMTSLSPHFQVHHAVNTTSTTYKYNMADTERKLSIDEMERLIEAVRCKPGIYNQRLPVYKDQF